MTDDITTSGGTPLENGHSWSFIVENCGYADFGGACFDGNALFEGASFSRNALFEGAYFGEMALFKGASFGEGAGFDRASFSRSAGFVHSHHTSNRHATGKGTITSKHLLHIVPESLW